MSCVNCECPFHEPVSFDGPSPDDCLCMITDAVKQANFKKGDTLFSRGQSSSSLYSLTSGTVKISCHSQNGEAQIVGLSTPGKLLAGLQSMSDDCYGYSAVAATDVSACKIGHRALLAAAEDRGNLALGLVSALNAQLAHSRALMRVLGHKCAAAKIASFILLLSPSSERARRAFTMPFSRMEIANILGLSEETVCRQMAKMRREGVIHAPRGKMDILDWDRLREIAGQRR